MGDVNHKNVLMWKLSDMRFKCKISIIDVNWRMMRQVQINGSLTGEGLQEKSNPNSKWVLNQK